jgi:PAS domain S-box-containing protein
MIEAAIHGRGPFVGQSASETARALQNYLLLRSAPLYLIGILIEQSQAMAGTLRESEERFRKMAHNAPMMLWMSDAEEKAVFLNAVWLKFTGRTLAQELGTGWTEGVHPQDIGCSLERCRAAVDAREPFEMEYRLRRHDGEYCWILNKAVPRYDADGEFAGYIGSAIDITAIKRAEETNRALARTHRLAVMGELTAAIAHEIRQPLSAISLDAQTAEMLVNSEKPSLPELREIVSDIRENVVRADSVIGGIKVFLGKSAAHIDKVDLNAVTSEVLWLLSGDATRRGVRVRTELGADVPPVLGDHTQLQQVLLNLVLNGMEAMETVPEPQRLLTVQTARNGDDVQVSVSDRGPGVPAEDVPRIFETFFTSKEGGMGMGLSIARSIVAAHRGRIWAEDNPRGGARFYFSVPAAKGEN